MARIVRDVLFYQAPERVFTVCYVVFGALVLGTALLVPMWRTSAREGRA